MASGGQGSGFNPPKKKGGFLTPKLLRKRDPSAGKDKERTEAVPRACTSSAPTVADAAVQVDHVPDCHLNTLRAEGRLSTSSENLAASTSKANSKRKSKTLTLRRKRTSENTVHAGKQGSRFWTFRLKKRFPVGLSRDTEVAEPPAESKPCVCTSFRKTEDASTQHSQGPMFPSPSSSSMLGASASPLQPNSSRSTRLAMGAGPGPSHVRRYNSHLFQLVPLPPASLADWASGSSIEYPAEDIDDLLIAQRARDMELGIEISPSHFAYPHLRYSMSSSSSSSGSSVIGDPTNSLNLAFQNQCVVTTTTTLYPSSPGEGYRGSGDSEYGEFSMLPAPKPASMASYIPRTVHTQIDYIHCLVPDLKEITKCSFYWGVIDRYEAERLLDNRPEGAFLLRDSAQEEFIFSVSFRRYGRSLHARIEQWNHKFSFDSHDPGVYASDTVCGLIEHYKDPSCCMFFEPMLTTPLTRTFPFSLQHLCRTIVCNETTYDGINYLPLPKPLRDYLKYYHYKQKVRVRQFEVNH